MSLRPACVDCGVFMVPQKNGYEFIELVEEAGGLVPGRLWSADLYVCPSCSRRILTGYGREPLAEAWEPKFGGMIANAIRKACAQIRYLRRKEDA